eukprot:5504706-Amphidinium_carterae.1
MEFSSILRCRWIIGHNDVEGEDNHRRAFGRNMSSVLGRSGFDPTISGAHRGSKETDGITLLSEGQQVPPVLANSPLGMPIVMECYTYAGRKSNQKLSAFLNCPVTPVTLLYESRPLGRKF